MFYTLGKVGEVVNPLGSQTIWLPGGAWSPDETDGPEQLSPSGHLEFDEAVLQFVTTDIFLPKSWDGKGLSAFVTWKHASTTTNFDVSFGIQAAAKADGEAYSQAFGTAQTLTDTGGLTDRTYYSGMFDNIVPSNSPEGGKLHELKFYRNPAADNLAVKAVVIGVTVLYDINRAKDN